MKRRLLNLAMGLSFAISLAVVALWIRSYWRGEGVGYASGQRNVAIEHGHGLMMLTVTTLRKGYFIPEWSHRSFIASPGWLATMAFEHKRKTGDRATVETWLFPHSVPAILTGSLTAFLAYRRYRGCRRFGNGSCQKCGYDLRESPDRCPECGTPNPASLKPQSKLQSLAG